MSYAVPPPDVESETLSLREASGPDALEALRFEWDALVERAPEPTPFLRAAWQTAWWNAFGKGRARIVTARDEAGELVAGGLFALGRTFFHGVPARTLSLASNVHSNRPDLLTDGRAIARGAAALAAWADANRQEWAVCVLDHVPADSRAARAFLAEMERRGHGSWVSPRETPPVVHLEGGWDAVAASLSSKWKSNLRNREKRLAALGAVEHDTIRTATGDLDARLDECFALEAKAWKGQAGSAISSDPATAAFYRAIAHAAAIDGTLALQLLHAGGRLAAFQLDLVARGVEYVLKIGYEPELSALSPGALLMRRTIEAACAQGLSAVDLLGDDMPWKRDWTRHRRPHVKILVFARGPSGALLEALETEAIPRLRAARDRWRGSRTP